MKNKIILFALFVILVIIVPSVYFAIKNKNNLEGESDYSGGNGTNILPGGVVAPIDPVTGGTDSSDNPLGL